MVDVVQAIRDAADALDQKNRRIAELEEALRPFARAADWIDRHGIANAMAELEGNDLRRARAALTQK